MSLLPSENEFINIHSHSGTAEEGVFTVYNVFAQDWQNIPPDKPVSIGLHPWHISDVPADITDRLAGCADLPNVVAIGESGIDKLTAAPLDLQEEIFIRHIELSERSGKPLVIHCVKAYPDIIRLRKNYRRTRWIIHGFNTKLNIINDLIPRDIYISIGSALLKNDSKLSELKNFLPLDYVLTESDESKNSIKELYTRLSGLYEMEVDDLRRKIRNNYMKVFKAE